MIDGYIMERDRILRKRRMDKRKKDIEEIIRRGVKMEIEKITGKKVNMEGGVNIGKMIEIENSEAMEQGSKLGEKGRGDREKSGRTTRQTEGRA